MSRGVGQLQRVQGFRDTLLRATTYDSWGQVLEACDEYDKLVKKIEKVLDSDKNDFNEHQSNFLYKVTKAVQMRKKSALDLTGERRTNLEDIMKIVPLLEILPRQVPANFPIHIVNPGNSVEKMMTARVPASGSDDQAARGPAPALARAQPTGTSAGAGGDEDEMDDEDEPLAQESSAQGTLLPYRRFPGQTAISIKMVSIEINDADAYIEPYITVQMRDKNGNTFQGGEPQDTPFTKHHSSTQLFFNTTVHLQLPYEALPPDAAIFFELKHWKAKKKKFSVKGFAFLEMDEIEESGAVPMELYQKPTNFQRKKLVLLGGAGYMQVEIIRKEE